ncbi:MAG: metal-dependent hydrolase [Gemmatimonadota bacterium]|nr:metal-dependent hydrolase [Gemmatimonadota bacterium]
MPSIISHAIAAGAIGVAFDRRAVPRRAIAAGVVLAMLPDADVIGMTLGVPYGSALGHRGLSHSLAFAVVSAAIATIALTRHGERRGPVFLYLVLAAASHGLLDALTNGGFGVALFAPFNDARLFFPVRPILVSPIGGRFFTARGLAVLPSEALWIWLPSAPLASSASAWRSRRQGPSANT